MKALLLVIAGVAIILAPRVQTTGTPGAGYTWSLGDLAAYEARIPGLGDHSIHTWADEHDTVAELLALGWADITIQAADCADNGSTSGADNGVITSAISAQCGGDGDCDQGGGGTVFRLDNESTCVFDLTSTITISQSNIAIVESPGTDVTVSCNNTTAPASTTGDTNMNRTYCLDVSASTSTASSVSWTAGAAQGDTAITVSDASAYAAGDMIRLSGVTSTGGFTQDWNVIVDAVDSGTDVITIRDGLPLAYNLASGSPTVVRRTGLRDEIILLDFDLGWIDVPAGAASTDSGTNSFSGMLIEPGGASRMLVQGMTLGPGMTHMISTSGFHTHNVYRGNVIRENLTSMRRGTRATSFNFQGSPNWVYDNVFKAGNPRLQNYEVEHDFNTLAFNYQEPQSPILGDTGTGYCSGDSITPAPGSIANNTGSGGGPGDRGVFFHGDTSTEDGSGHLIERNVIDCIVEMQASIEYDGFTTFFGNESLDPRSRANSSTGNWSHGFGSGGNSHYWNIFANGMRRWNRIDQMPNLLGVYNMARASGDSSASGSGATWPTSSTGRNLESISSGAHTDCGSMDIPPSLMLRVGDAPDWWCQEACDWGQTMTFGACTDGCKLPAQIRAEGTTCTPP